MFSNNTNLKKCTLLLTSLIPDRNAKKRRTNKTEKRRKNDEYAYLSEESSDSFEETSLSASVTSTGIPALRFKFQRHARRREEDSDESVELESDESEESASSASEVEREDAFDVVSSPDPVFQSFTAEPGHSVQPTTDTSSESRGVDKVRKEVVVEVAPSETVEASVQESHMDVSVSVDVDEDDEVVDILEGEREDAFAGDTVIEPDPNPSSHDVDEDDTSIQPTSMT